MRLRLTAGLNWAIPLCCILLLTACPSPTPSGDAATDTGADVADVNQVDAADASDSPAPNDVLVSDGTDTADDAPLAGDEDGDHHASMAAGGDDCDDADPNRYPGNMEVCDAENHDEDCDVTTFGSRDADADGHTSALCCNVEPSGAMHCGDDCNDSRPSVHPANVEVCNGLDDNCDGQVDEGVSLVFYRDSDNDGFGDGTAPMSSCVPGPGVSTNGTDCDDTNAAVHPGAVEVCDPAMVDENCNGTANEGC